MALQNSLSNLPGHLVTFKDGGLRLTTTNTDTSSTKSLLILGTATDGPINEPVKIDAITVSQVFGKEVNAKGYPNGATLTKYAKQAFKNGFDDVRCMRVTGSQAYATIYGEETTGFTNETVTILGSTQGENSGTIKGNNQFDYKSYEEDNCFVRQQGDSTEGFGIDVNGNGPEGFSVADKIEFHDYTGFTIKPNAYAHINSLSLKAPAMRFNGNTDTDKVSVKKQVQTLTVSEDDSVLQPVKFDLKTNTDSDNNTVIAPIFTALVNDNALPNLKVSEESNDSILNSDGFKISIRRGLTDVVTDAYSVSIDEDNKQYVITPNTEGENLLQDGDEITIEYYPYEMITLEKTFTAETINTVNSSSIDISDMDGKQNASISSITIYKDRDNSKIYLPTDEGYNSVFSTSGNTLTVNHTADMAVGAEIRVTYTYEKPIVSELELNVKSQWGGSLYKDASVEVVKYDGEDREKYTSIILTKPSSKTSSKKAEQIIYSSETIKTVDELILAMRNDLNNLNMFEIEIVKGEGTDSIDLLQASTVKTFDNGGEDGIKVSNDEMFRALSGDRYTEADVGTPISPNSSVIVTDEMVGYLKTQGAYQILENYNVDYIYPAGVYADGTQNVNPLSDFQRELALACAAITFRTKMTLGFIDVKPNSNTTLVGIDAYVANLVNSHPNIYYMTDSEGNVLYDDEDNPMDIGWYTSVVVGPEPVMQSDTLGTYYGSPAIAYAALNAVLEPQSSPLNKALRNVSGMKFKFSNKQANAITGNRMVCFKLKNEGMATASSTPYVVDGITSGAPNCDYSDIAVVKVVTDVVDNIRQVADPFIGEPNTLAQRNALSALISKRLAQLVELNEIQSYEFEVFATLEQQLLGEASIALTIVPAMTLKKITTIVALRAAE